MKRLHLILLGALAAGCASGPPPPAGSPCSDSPAAQEDRIDDNLILRALRNTGTRLLREKKATPGSELRGQLDRKSCRLDLPPRPDEALSPSRIYRDRRSGVAVVGGLYSCGKCTRWHTTVASGVVLTAGGAVATNYHVLEGEDRETFVVYVDGRGAFPVREVLAASRRHDLAILRLELPEGTALTPVPVAADAPVGAPVTVISHPSQRFFMLTRGVVSRYFSMHRKGGHVPAMAITADYAKGSSGAPVLDDTGSAVGIVASTHSIYYETDGDVQKNLQMVVKQCVPSASLLELIERP